jgi:hypothetical protein
MAVSTGDMSHSRMVLLRVVLQKVLSYTIYGGLTHSHAVFGIMLCNCGEPEIQRVKIVLQNRPSLMLHHCFPILSSPSHGYVSGTVKRRRACERPTPEGLRA